MILLVDVFTPHIHPPPVWPCLQASPGPLLPGRASPAGPCTPAHIYIQRMMRPIGHVAPWFLIHATAYSFMAKIFYLMTLGRRRRRWILMTMHSSSIISWNLSHKHTCVCLCERLRFLTAVTDGVSHFFFCLCISLRFRRNERKHP